MDMKIILSKQFEDMVREKVVSGLYASASEVVNEALRLMLENDLLQLEKVDQLRQDIQDGLTSGAAVQWDPDEVKRTGRAKRAAKAESGV